MTNPKMRALLFFLAFDDSGTWHGVGCTPEHAVDDAVSRAFQRMDEEGSWWPIDTGHPETWAKSLSVAPIGLGAVDQPEIQTSALAALLSIPGEEAAELRRTLYTPPAAVADRLWDLVVFDGDRTERGPCPSGLAIPAREDWRAGREFTVVPRGAPTPDFDPAGVVFNGAE